MSPNKTVARHPHPLLDMVIQRHALKNDAALSRALQLSAPSISKIRRRTLGVSADVVLRIHERFQIPVVELRKLIEER